MEKALTIVAQPPSLPLLELISNFTHLKRVTAWMLHFVSNCHHNLKGKASRSGPWTMQELVDAEAYWIAVAQESNFVEEILTLRKGRTLSNTRDCYSLSVDKSILESRQWLIDNRN